MTWVGDAWDWAEDKVSDAWGSTKKGAKDTFSQDKAVAYKPNQANFQFGGEENYAKNRANQLSDTGVNAANNGANRGQFQGNVGTHGNAVQQARALGYQSQGNAAANQGFNRAANQGVGSQYVQQGAQRDASGFATQGGGAQSRQGVTVQNNDLNSVNRGIEEQSRSQQMQTAQALGFRANDGSGQTNTQALNNFAGQTGNGPSAAQAQMQQGSDRAMSDALALARSGRGNNTQAVRQAQFQNAATEQATNQNLSTLRAQEYDQAQNRQLNALGQASQAQLGYRGQDLSALQAQGSLVGQARGMDQSQQQIGIGQGQFDANLGLQNRQLNDATALGWAGQQQQAQARADAAYFQGQQLGNQSIGQAQQYGLGLQGLGQQASVAGQQYDLGMQGLANQSIGQANQFNMGMQGMANQTLANQLEANIGYEGMKGGNAMSVNLANTQYDQQRDAANIGAFMGGVQGIGMMAASDEREKKDVHRLGGKLGEMYEALGGQPLPSDTSASGIAGYLFKMGSGQGMGMQGMGNQSLGQQLGALTSDERTKTNIRPMGDDATSYGAASLRVPGYRAPRAAASAPQEQGTGLLKMAAAIASKDKANRAQEAKGSQENAKDAADKADAWRARLKQPDFDALDDAYRKQNGVELGGVGATYPRAQPPDTSALDRAHALASNNFAGNDDPYDLNFSKRGSAPSPSEDPYDLWASNRAGDPYDLWASNKSGDPYDLAASKTTSDERSKKNVSSRKGQMADAVALGFKPEAPDTDALDDAQRSQGGSVASADPYDLYASNRGGDPYDMWASDKAGGAQAPRRNRGAFDAFTGAPRVDLRNAQGYSYQYKDPSMPGAAPGTHYGPMAQDLERSPATASTVVKGPDGVKRVDTGRLALVNTAALADQQRDLHEMKRILANNNGPGYDRDALDEAYRRQARVY